MEKVEFNRENILIAYQATGALPRAGRWFMNAEREVSLPACGCPVGVFVRHFYGEVASRDARSPNAPTFKHAKLIGKSTRWITSFIQGFDGFEDSILGGDAEAFRFGREMAGDLLTERSSL